MAGRVTHSVVSSSRKRGVALNLLEINTDESSGRGWSYNIEREPNLMSAKE